jgi:hypothetical protein
MERKPDKLDRLAAIGLVATIVGVGVLVGSIAMLWMR